MSVVKKAAAGAIAMSLIALPGVAQAAGASKLSVANAAPIATSARVSARSSKKSKQEGGGIAVAVLAAAAVVGGVIAATSDGGDSN